MMGICIQGGKSLKDWGSAIILCGGKSSRMGFDKSSIRIGNKLLMELIAEELEEVFDEIILVADNKNKFSNIKYKVVADQQRDCGPAAGILTGLMAAASNRVFVIACDMPFINKDYIKYMIKVIEEEGPDCVITKNGHWIEPLYAFYSKNMIDSFEKSINMRNFRLFDIIKKSNVHFVEEEVVRRFTKDKSIFINLNYIEDLDIIKKIYGREVSTNGQY